jgi:hypothetical protein
MAFSAEASALAAKVAAASESLLAAPEATYALEAEREAASADSVSLLTTGSFDVDDPGRSNVGSAPSPSSLSINFSKYILNLFVFSR